MKKSPQEQEQETLLSPSKFSAEGFLGNDQRTVDEIIAEDRRTLERLGATCESVARLLSNAFDRAESKLGVPVDLVKGVAATHFEARGKLPSPFRGEGVFRKGEVSVTEKGTGKTFFITKLGIHLIRTHCFFQGRGSRYRIEPEEVIGILGKPDFPTAIDQ